MKRTTDYIVIVFVGLVTHGLLLLNDGIYWDEWLSFNLPERIPNWANALPTASEMGVLPTNVYYSRLLGVFDYRLMVFVSIMLSGILVYMICQGSGLVSSAEGLFVALIAITYPAFQTWIVHSTSRYVNYYSLFFLATFLAVKAEGVSGLARYALRVGSLGIFFLSFGLSSLLVFYFGFLLFLVTYARRRNELSLRQVFTNVLPRRLDFLLLPFVFWIVKEVFFPRHGLYADYNLFKFSVRSLALHSITFLNNAVYGQLNSALEEAVRQPALWLLILLAIQWAYSAFRVSSARFFDTRVNSYALLAFGLVLLVLGIFPYVAVGQSPSLHGWNTRHALLVALPMAFIIIAITRLAFPDPAGFLSKPGFTFLVTLLLAFSVSTITNYISWQARWVKDRSIMANLATLDNAQGISVFWVDDHFPAGGERGTGAYRFYEWSSIFKTVWGDESRIGFDQGLRAIEPLVVDQRYFNERYNLADFDPAGCQAMLTIRRGPLVYSDAGLSARYLFYRFFRSEGRLAKFLSGVTDVQVQPISAPEAVNCPTQ